MLNPWTEEQDKILKGPYLYLSNVPGKDLRSILVSAFNSILNIDQHHLSDVSTIISTLHTASLIIDDVEDNADLRRGKPVAHSIYGIAQTINCSNYMIFEVLAKIQKLNNPDITNIFCEEMINAHRGQGLELYWRETLTCPTEDEYLAMALNKTGVLCRLAARLMHSLSSNNSQTGDKQAIDKQATDKQNTDEVDLVPFANLLGIVYQIQDDYLSLQSPKYADQKGFCEDITEGKFSFPIIHAIHKDSSNKELINILRQKTSDENLKKRAIEIMQQMGSFEYCRSKIEEYRIKCNNELDVIKEKGHDITELDKILHAMLSVT